MFKGLSDLAQVMKHAQNLKGRLADVQDKLAEMRVEGSAGGGMVTVEADGRQTLIACRIDPSIIGEADRELLEDLVVSAVNQALDKSREMAAEEMTGAMGGLDLPGVKEAISRLS